MTAAVKARRFEVAGLQYRCDLAGLRALRQGDPVTLTREPNNRYDDRAVMVSRGDVHLGYVPRERAAEIAPLIDQGWQIREARIDQIHPADIPAAWEVVVALDLLPPGDAA